MERQFYDSNQIEGISELRDRVVGRAKSAYSYVNRQLKRLPPWAPWAIGGVAAAGILFLATRKASASGGKPMSTDTSVKIPAGINWAGIVAATAGHESRGNYGAFNPNDENRGISWGLVQFNQGAGSIGRVLLTWRSINSTEFYNWAGGQSVGDDLISKLNNDSDTVKLSLKLNTPAWEAKWRAAGKIANVQTAQNVDIWRSYGKPVLDPVTRILGLTNQTLAVAFDRAIQQGPGAVKAALTAVSGKAPAGSAEILELFKNNVINRATKKHIPAIYKRWDKVWKNTAKLV